jgi:hypothetical protein
MAADITPRRFLHVGNEFRVGTERWWGDAVMGAEAIYVLPSAPARGRKYAAVMERLADRLLPTRTLPRDVAATVPDALLADTDWPVPGAGKRPAIIVPRAAVAFLYHERGKLETRLVFRGVEIAIPHGRFGAKPIRTFAEAAAWPMFWDDTPINLPGRSGAQVRAELKTLPFGRPTLSYALIGGGFVLGALPIGLQLARGLNPDLVSTLWLAAWIIGVALILFGWVALRRGF